MKGNWDRVYRLEKLIASEEGPLPLEKAFRIVNGLREEAVALGRWASGDPMEGIEVDIRVARILTRISATKPLVRCPVIPACP